VANGATELALVSGYAGIGKSSLVNELQKALVPTGGRFASGKFDQYKRDIPYATLAQAFRSLVRPLLGESEAELGRWRDSLSEALGPNGQLIVNLIPELGLVIGKPPSVADLPPRDAQNRFQLVFRRFLGVFARVEHPLVLFLDDLQWLDAATLGRVIDPSVDDFAVARAHPRPDGVFRLDDDDLAASPRQRARDRETDNTGADNEAFDCVHGGLQRVEATTLNNPPASVRPAPCRHPT
jgi:hypothetical protein